MLTRGEDKYTSASLGVLDSQLVNIALKLHSEENKYISAKLKFNSASPRWTSSWEIELQIAEIELETKSVKFNTNYRWT